MESNSQTITLAGETLTEADWPVDVDWYNPNGSWHQTRNNVRGVFLIASIFQHENLYCAMCWLSDDAPACAVREVHRILLPWIADRCRCWFLDKACEVRGKLCQIPGKINIATGDYELPPLANELQSQVNQLDASAAKWARIGRSGAK